MTSMLFVSAPIHSSVSGTVTAIEEQRSAVGGSDTLVVIETDKKQEIYEGVKPPEVNDLQGFVKAIRDSGLVGLGGASFPTHIKFNPKNIDEVHTLIVNAAECEPFYHIRPQTHVRGCRRSHQRHTAYDEVFRPR